MAYVPVPKDLSKVKNKVFFNLTARQIICFLLAGVVGVPFYFLTKGAIGTDIAAMIMVVLMLPFFFLGLYEKDGLSAEKILLNYIWTKYKKPTVRLYKTENIYQYLEDERKGVRPLEEKKKKCKKTKQKRKAK
jgi:hypothetical protein